MTGRCPHLLAVMIVTLAASTALAQEGAADRPIVGKPVTPTKVEVDLRTLPKLKLPATGVVVREVPRRALPKNIPAVNPGPHPDPLVQLGTGAARAAAAVPAPSLSFEGVSFTGAYPPDPVGDVGPDHYIQMVNTVFTIYDKSGTLLAGPSDISTLWTPAGGICSTHNDGDPIVLYDPLADRWILSQFAEHPGEHECIAVSQTGDPVNGGFYLYDFTVPVFPDYPKLGVWTDAYYMGSNLKTDAGLYAFDRAAMLQGQPAGFVSFTVPALGYHSMVIPADLDGPAAPPAGAPGLFYRFVDGATGGGSDRLQLWELHADFVVPGDSTLSGPQEIPTAAFALLCTAGGLTFNCIAQKGTLQKVDSITEWPMFRLQYRNFGSYETLVGNHSVDVGANQSGVRWFELQRSQGSTWSLRQEGTWTSGLNSRWMASAAMDRAGDIALAYSLSGVTTYPSLGFTARLYGDTAGEMTLGEGSLVAGGGSQTAANRWGDYSSLSVDPSDGCTFWYTGEYFATSSLYNWNTRIGAFTLPECTAFIFRDDFEYDNLGAWSAMAP